VHMIWRMPYGNPCAFWFDMGAQPLQEAPSINDSKLHQRFKAAFYIQSPSAQSRPSQ